MNIVYKLLSYSIILYLASIISIGFVCYYAFVRNSYMNFSINTFSKAIIYDILDVFYTFGWLAAESKIDVDVNDDNGRVYIGSKYSIFDVDVDVDIENTLFVNCSKDLPNIGSVCVNIPFDDIPQEINVDRMWDLMGGVLKPYGSYKNVYFYCNYGMQRSVLCALIYIMKKYEMNYDDALSLVKRNRWQAFFPMCVFNLMI